MSERRIKVDPYVRQHNKISRERGNVFTVYEVLDVLDVIAEKQVPNAEFGDDECWLWSAVSREFNVTKREY